MKFQSILSVVLLCGLYAAAQEPYERKVKFGIKAGVNGSLFTRTVEPFGEFQENRYNEFERFLRFSGLGGVTADAIVSNRISIGAEVLFNSRGMAYREKNYDVVILDENGNAQQAYNDFNYNIDYIEFPITLNLNFTGTMGKVWFAPYAGIAPAIKIHSMTKLRYEKSPNGGRRGKTNEKMTLTNVNHFNNSLLAGFKVGEVKSQGASVFGDLRISHTLLPVFKRSAAGNGNNLDTRMLTFSASVGLRF